MNEDKETEEALKQFAMLTPEQQKHVYDAMVRDEAIQRFRSMPQEEQASIHSDLSELFTRLRSEWEAKPENAGKTVTYTQLWNDHIRKKE